MTPAPEDLALEEYRALRATIRERGTMRLIVVAITFVAWAALAILVQALIPIPLFSLIPLLVLAAGFEVIFATHVAVERIGRFLQVRYEFADPNLARLPAWENTAMALGRERAAATGIDPLAAGYFVAAAALNLVPAFLAALDDGPKIVGVIPSEFALLAGIHLLFVWRLFRARRFAAAQRQRDLDTLTRLAPTTETQS